MSCENDNRTRNACDVTFFDALYREHHRVLHACLVGLCAQSETAADLLQETFLRVWQHIEEARQVPATRQRFWLLAVARNLAYDHRRRRAVRQHLEAALPVEDSLLADSSSDPVATLTRQETETAIEAAIARLPLDLRTVLTMSLLGEMSSQEIGAALGIPAGTVRYRVLQARRRLKQDLQLITHAEPVQKESKHGTSH